MGLTGCGHLALLHGPEQCSLSLGWRSVDLVCQKQVGEDRALHKLEHAPTRRGIFFQDISPGDIARHQVWSELDAPEVQVQGGGRCLHDQRLGQSWHANKQAVASSEECSQHQIDDGLLTHDAASHLFEERLSRLGRQIDNLLVTRVYGHFSDPKSSGRDQRAPASQMSRIILEAPYTAAGGRG